MADFHTVLKRAVTALPDKSGPNRRAVYDKARKALLKQLQSLDPPLPAQEVTQQRLALEDAIRKLEAEIARAGRTAPSAASPTAPAAARPSVQPRPAPPRAAPPAEEEAADEQAQAPRPAAPRPPVAPPSRAAAPTVTPRAPLSAPARPSPAAPQPPVSDADDGEPEAPQAAAPEPAPRRREPTLGRTAAPAPVAPPPAPEEPDAEEVDEAPAEPEARRGAFRRPFGRGSAARGAPVVPPGAGPQDDLSEEEIEEAAAEAEAPAIAPAADRRGWLRRRKAAPEPAVEPTDDDVSDEAGEAYAEEGYEESYAEEAYEDEAYDEEHYDETAEDAAYYAEEETGRRRSFRWLVAPLIILLILAGGAFALYSQRDAIMAMMTAPSDTAGETASSTPSTPTTGTASDADSNKISDRLGGPSDGASAPVVAPDARTVKTTRVVTPRNGNGETASSGGEALPGAAPAPAVPSQAASGAARTEAAAQEGTRESAPAPAAGSFEAVLYEEGASAAQGGNALRGSIDWQYTEESIGGQPPEPVVKATLTIPERDMTVDLLFRKNSDSALPASHLIEAQFNLPSDFPGGGIANVPGLILKQTEAAQGNALLGASAKVSDNLFWIALSATEADQQKNLQLLKDRSWIDIPLLYTNGGRAILTLDKGSEGSEAIDQALTAWGG